MSRTQETYPIAPSEISCVLPCIITSLLSLLYIELSLLFPNLELVAFIKYLFGAVLLFDLVPSLVPDHDLQPNSFLANGQHIGILVTNITVDASLIYHFINQY